MSSETRRSGTILRRRRRLAAALALTSLAAACRGPAPEPEEARGATTGAPAAAGGAPAADEISHYTCSMHPQVRSERPGACPICGMALVPVLRAEVESGEVVVDPQRRQAIGVRTGAVVRRSVQIEVRAVGRVAYDESRLTDVSVKYRGWVGELFVGATGEPVRRGQKLLTLYSPELYATQQEFLSALRSQSAARSGSVPDRADYLVEAARQRLRLWDLEERQIDEIARTGEAAKYLPVVSPASGYLIEKDVVEGAAVEPGTRLFRIAGLDSVWVEAEIPESELALVTVGQEAEVELTHLPGEPRRGTVTRVLPYLAPGSRTGRVRIELANPRTELKPEMYAEVRLRVDRGERLMVPKSAVVFSGERRLVFLELGEGRLRPQPVEIGVESGEELEVLSGLREGDSVVTSGTFLVAAESRLRSGVEGWR